MNTETLKKIGWWVFSVSIIVLIIFWYRSCESREDKKQAEKEYIKQEQVLHDQYLYRDINGVYHIYLNCRMLTRHHYDSEDNRIYDSYSSSYVSRNSIKNWYDFAATHQLCSKCFSPELIRQLDSVWMDYIRDENEDYYNIHSSKERIVAPWVTDTID